MSHFTVDGCTSAVALSRSLQEPLAVPTRDAVDHDPDKKQVNLQKMDTCLPYHVSPYLIGIAITAFLLGCSLGIMMGRNDWDRGSVQGSTTLRLAWSLDRTTHLSNTGAFVFDWMALPDHPTVHTDAVTGQSIVKKLLMESGIVPHVTGFSVAVLQPGQRVDWHHHASMYEFFFLLQGTALCEVVSAPLSSSSLMSSSSNNLPPTKRNEMKAGSFWYVVPGEQHSIWVPEASADPAYIILVGTSQE